MAFSAPPPRPATQTSSGEKSNEPRPYCSLFDLTKHVPETILEEANISILNPLAGLEYQENGDDYETLIENIRKLIVDNNFR